MKEKLVITVKEAYAISGVNANQIRAWVKNGTWSGVAYKGTSGRYSIYVDLIPLCKKLGISTKEAYERM